MQCCVLYIKVKHCHTPVVTGASTEYQTQQYWLDSPLYNIQQRLSLPSITKLESKQDQSSNIKQ